MDYYFRNFENDISLWFKENVQEALIIEGARQVGKTTGILNWAKRNNIKMLAVDLLQYKSLALTLCNVKTYENCLSEISIATNQDVNEYDVIFLDEIQVHYDLLYLPRLFKNKKIKLICSGSLLGLRLAKEINRTDIGSKQYLSVYPLDFHEFMIWNKKGILIKEIDYAFENKTQITNSAHKELYDLFIQFLIVGGMPRIVRTYVEANQTIVPQIYTLKDSILKDYINDNHNSLYTGTNLRKEIIKNMDSIYLKAPLFLSEEYKRFKIDSLGKNIRYNNIEKPLLCLLSSNILIPSYLIESVAYPLNLHKKETLFKLYYSDIGLLTQSLKIDYDMLRKWTEGNKTISSLIGGVIENFVAIEVHKQELFYFKKDIINKGEKYKNRYELDFLFNWDDGSIVPCEVKSSVKQASNAKSFNWFKEKYNPNISLFIGPNNLHFLNNEIKIPIYATYKIRNWIK